MDGTSRTLVAGFLRPLTPIVVDTAVWPGGMDFALKAYVTGDQPPVGLVSSMRSHRERGRAGAGVRGPPSQRRCAAGRSMRAGRVMGPDRASEVLEEAGWRVDPHTLSALGFVHFRHLTPVADDHPFPHPDFFQVVLSGEGHGTPEDWVDVES